MNVTFRADASLKIGSGHIFRCLSLAEGLRAKGAKCIFICKNHKNHLGVFIKSKGFKVYLIEANENDYNGDNKHSSWLGGSQLNDASQCKVILNKHQVDWIIVDHYALDFIWHNELRSTKAKIMVIDDLADRVHSSDVLLDQTFGRKADDYTLLVKNNTKLLMGSKFALLRSEFKKIRKKSLKLRKNRLFRNLLISFGGYDKDNLTGQIIDKLIHCDLHEDTKITIIIGANSPWTNIINKKVKVLPWKTLVLSGVKDMAEIMCTSDLAIGSAGSTSWERCALGLPAIQIVSAVNQLIIAKNLENIGAAKTLKNLDNLKYIISSANEWIRDCSDKCKNVTDGFGVKRVITEMEKFR